MPGKSGSRKTRRRKHQPAIAPRKNAMLLRNASKERSLKSKKIQRWDRDWVLASLGRPPASRSTPSQTLVRPEFLDPPRRRR